MRPPCFSFSLSSKPPFSREFKSGYKTPWPSWISKSASMALIMLYPHVGCARIRRRTIMSVRFLPMRCTICFLKLSDTAFPFPVWFWTFGFISFRMFWYVFLCYLVASMLISTGAYSKSCDMSQKRHVVGV